jgi:hypothetical protein
LGCFHPWADNLSPGERASVLILATDRTQAKTIFRYAEALLDLMTQEAQQVALQVRLYARPRWLTRR